jgi:dTDP-4-amino-4,6-dideoxygalactose transaminase
MPHARQVYHVYAVRHPRRDSLQAALGDQGVHTGIHYPIPVHQQEAYSNLGYRAGDFPHSERAAQQTLSLPIYPELTGEQVTEVVTCLRRVLSG